MLNFLLQTFGCKSNQYESQGIRESLLAAGWRETPAPEEADVLVLNSCGVTGRAGASCRNAVRKAVRANPCLRVVVTGCGVDLGEAWPEIPAGEPLLLPNAQKHAIPGAVSEWLSGAATPAAFADDRFGLAISSFHGHTRAFLKIQDGCDNFCSYCAVPLARGAPQSRPPGEVLAEARRLVDAGHRELVLTGINIGVYRDGATEFPDLVARVAGVPGLERLRLGSVEPPQLTERLAATMRDCGAVVCPHIHLPLQSGDDGVLAAMGRRYDVAAFLGKVDMLKAHLARPAITSDVIVGFPGEDEAAFERSVETCRRAGFSRLHVFLFSARPGTPAAGMKRRVPDREVEGWKSRLIAVGRELAVGFADGCVGMEERVIVERAGVAASGLSDRYVTMRFDGRGLKKGEAVGVLATERSGVELLARMV